MKFRIAKNEDIQEIMDIIKKAQIYLKNQGVNQWQNNYPNKDAIQTDIDKKDLYLLVEDKDILGIVALSFEGEDTYEKIYEGQWITHDKYAVIHRMAVDMDKKRNGLGNAILEEVEKICISKNIKSIKIDTHRDNKSMRGLLEKNGFIYCGIIYLKDGNERIAFEKVLI